jgi:hypothetical protein
MSDSKFLYLTRSEWVTTWTVGGEVPLQVASAYRGSERQGTSTPDEVIHRELHGMAERDFEKLVKVGPNATAFITIGQAVIDGRVRGQDVSFVQKQIDGLILCLSNSYSREILTRLQKTACVEIPDWQRLLASINDQLGVTGFGNKVEYTISSDRNHFLKSVEDAWQDEFRLFWPLTAAATVKIDANMAVAVASGT